MYIQKQIREKSRSLHCRINYQIVQVGPGPRPSCLRRGLRPAYEYWWMTDR